LARGSSEGLRARLLLLACSLPLARSCPWLGPKRLLVTFSLSFWPLIFYFPFFFPIDHGQRLCLGSILVRRARLRPSDAQLNAFAVISCLPTCPRWRHPQPRPDTRALDSEHTLQPCGRSSVYMSLWFRLWSPTASAHGVSQCLAHPSPSHAWAAVIRLHPCLTSSSAVPSYPSKDRSQLVDLALSRLKTVHYSARAEPSSNLL
jgi:hypothetical protein